MPKNNKCPHPYQSGLTRREFLKQSSLSTLLAGILAYKPGTAKDLISDKTTPTKKASLSTRASPPSSFLPHERATLKAVQLQLFPADGDGPSATDINALTYLEWALTDPDNKEDGDRAFIIEGISWLDTQSTATYQRPFIQLSHSQQHDLLDAFSIKKVQENWMSLLVYYLLEALLLDPVYAGNPNGIGWKWLQHQAGFPRPPTDKTYRYFQMETLL